MKTFYIGASGSNSDVSARRPWPEKIPRSAASNSSLTLSLVGKNSLVGNARGRAGNGKCPTEGKKSLRRHQRALPPTQVFRTSGEVLKLRPRLSASQLSPL